MSIDVNRNIWGGHTDPPCLVTTVLEQVDRNSSRIAVIDGDKRFTYGQMLAWAGEIACLLREHGSLPGERIAVACPRSAEAVAALLAVTLAGRAYVPLDLEYPGPRLAHMLKDCGARFVICRDRPTGFDTVADFVYVPPCPADPSADRSWIARPDQDAPVYVIYTSGSTGWPKGVVLQHTCLDNVAAWQAEFSPAPDLRTAQFAPLNFDVSFQEIFGTLCGGGTLVIMPERLRREPSELLGWLAEHRVERLFLPYVALQMISVAAQFAVGTTDLALVEVNVAGEQLVCTEEIRTFFRALPRCRLVNHYGQSESAMVTAYALGTNPDEWPVLPPIGYPLPGCELLIDTQEPGRTDVGELLVAGLPVALGYVDQPELNRQRYVDVELTPYGNKRAFRTGDLVRLTQDGVQFLTRVDDDVKIRGVRVNLGEVDAQLMALPEITAAVSVVVQHEVGRRGLHAGVTIGQDHEWDEEDVLSRLRNVLPDVSVPVSVVVLDTLPRAPSGKVDRQAVAEAIVGVDRKHDDEPNTTGLGGATDGRFVI
jgi:D-alanine--poly(phosphoribitol) ligase subunit 1